MASRVLHHPPVSAGVCLEAGFQVAWAGGTLLRCVSPSFWDPRPRDGGARTERPNHTSVIHMSGLVTPATIPLAKPSHLVKKREEGSRTHYPRVEDRGELRGQVCTWGGERIANLPPPPGIL